MIPTFCMLCLKRCTGICTQIHLMYIASTLSYSFNHILYYSISSLLLVSSCQFLLLFSQNLVFLCCFVKLNFSYRGSIQRHLILVLLIKNGAAWMKFVIDSSIFHKVMIIMHTSCGKSLFQHVRHMSVTYPLNTFPYSKEDAAFRNMFHEPWQYHSEYKIPIIMPVNKPGFKITTYCGCVPLSCLFGN